MATIDKCRSLGRPELKYDFGTCIYDKLRNKVTVYFVTDHMHNFDTLHPDLIKIGLQKAIRFLGTDKRALNKGAALIKLYYHNDNEGYRIFFAQFRDGTSFNYG